MKIALTVLETAGPARAIAVQAMALVDALGPHVQSAFVRRTIIAVPSDGIRAAPYARLAV